MISNHELNEEDKFNICLVIFDAVLDWINSPVSSEHKVAEILTYLDSIGYDNQDNRNWRAFVDERATFLEGEWDG